MIPAPKPIASLADQPKAIAVGSLLPGRAPAETETKFLYNAFRNEAYSPRAIMSHSLKML